jgi:flavin reductase (DIM6/NTAB) family NADH-FMN oxidoreductase RutF
MANVCAPVSIIGTRTDDGQPYATTVSAFASLSLEPPMVTASLDRGSVLLEHVRRSRTMGINILADGQGDLARTFARSRPDKFDGVDWAWEDGVPRLAGVTSWLGCSVSQLVPGGDHVIVLGEVMRVINFTGLPLVYARRVFGTHSHLASAESL